MASLWKKRSGWFWTSEILALVSHYLLRSSATSLEVFTYTWIHFLIIYPALYCHGISLNCYDRKLSEICCRRTCLSSCWAPSTMRKCFNTRTSDGSGILSSTKDHILEPCSCKTVGLVAVQITACCWSLKRSPMAQGWSPINKLIADRPTWWLHRVSRFLAGFVWHGQAKEEMNLVID